MPVIESTRDPEALTLTVVSDFAAPPERVWQVWEDPRQLERWWGPPTWPATFTAHDFRPGGESQYHMTGPGGEKAPGWWRSLVVEPTSRYEFDDGFSDESGTPKMDLPTTHTVVTLAEHDGGTRMTTVSRFDTLADLEQLMAMGMQEGMEQAQNQIDAIVGH